MSFNLNHVTLAGHITRDPEVRQMKERTLTTFGLAVNRCYKGKEGAMTEEVCFIDLECWGKTAELVGQYCQKGDPVFIEGYLKLDSWKTKDGTPRQTLKVVADRVQFLRPPREKQEAEQQPVRDAAKVAAPARAAVDPDFPDEVPF